MSWVSGIKEIRLRGMKSVKLTIPQDELSWYGSFYPLYVNNRQVIDTVFADVKPEVLLGKGNYSYYAWELDDFNFESMCWPNFWTDYDDAVLDAQTDFSMLYGWLSLDIITENEFTGEEKIYHNIITLVAYTENTKENNQLRISLGGFYSPAQDLIFSNFSNVAGMDKVEILFHECSHALTRSAEDLLKYTMYGSSESEVKEEIMTHLFTDRFKSFKALESYIRGSISVKYDIDGDWKKPAAFEISSNNLSDESDITGKGSLIQTTAVVQNQTLTLNGLKVGALSRNGIKTLRGIQFNNKTGVPDKKNRDKLKRNTDYVNKRRKSIMPRLLSDGVIGKSKFIPVGSEE